jgi:glycosyltransferase involved in cell wall biosynthesis
MRTVLHVGPSQTRGGMGAVIQLLAANAPDGWNAEVMPSHADGGVIPVLRAWWKVRKELDARLQRGNVDIVHIHTATRWSWKRKMGLIKIAQRAHIPVILSLHSGDFDRHCKERGPEVHRICSTLHAVVLTNLWQERLSPWLNESSVIPNPVPDVPVSSERDRMQFLLMGRPNPMKGQDIAMEATRRLRNAGLNVTLHLTGIDYNELGIVGHGWVDGDEKEHLMRTCGTLLSPSKWEGLSMAVIEAMARGMPVLASNASVGVFEKSGDIVETTAIAYSEAMKKMLEGDTWGKMAASGPDEAKKYNLNQVIPMWGKLYDEVAR